MADPRPAVVACLLLLGCAGPTVRDEAVRSQAEKSAQAMVSELRTTYLVTGAQLDDRTWWRFTDVVVTDAEAAATAIEDTFTSRQPPSAEVAPLYEATATALSDAAGLVTDARIAVRMHDEAALRDLRPRLDQAAGELERTR